MAANKEKCPSCGQFIKAGSPFCIRCGAQINKLTIEDETPKTESEPVQTQHPAPAESKRLKPATYIEHPAITEPERVLNDTPTHNPEPEETHIPYQYHTTALSSMNDRMDSDNEDPDDEESEMMVEEELEEESFDNDEDPDDEIEEDDDLEDPESDPVEDDDETFFNLLEQKRNKADQKKPDNPTTPASSGKRKVLNKNTVQKEPDNISKAQPTQKQKVQMTDHVTPKTAKTVQPKEKAMPKYDPNSDHYYDNVMAEVDARISHFSKENVVLTCSFVILCIVILVAMIYCVVL